ncbi:hypothetical protein [Alkalihalobacillus sp. BA299]|uniref:hypothetical protein n=1 Tax=Alkalihalobacillus sp. BA299 TaxID=2815938 RepID=UPI0027DE96C1|nr:hypothetical protein [Alkalihalobacillus sp. BA299]
MKGLTEIGEGYLIWLKLREGKSYYWGVIGGVALALYGVIATFRKTAYGWGIVLSLMWKKILDLYDWLGADICLFDVSVMLFAPRQ